MKSTIEPLNAKTLFWLGTCFWLSLFYLISIAMLAKASFYLLQMTSTQQIYSGVLPEVTALFIGRWLIWSLEFPLSSNSLLLAARYSLTYMDVWVMLLSVITLFTPRRFDGLRKHQVYTQILFILYLLISFLFYGSIFYGVVAMHAFKAIPFLRIIGGIIAVLSALSLLVFSFMIKRVMSIYVVR